TKSLSGRQGYSAGCAQGATGGLIAGTAACDARRETPSSGGGNRFATSTADRCIAPSCGRSGNAVFAAAERIAQSRGGFSAGACRTEDGGCPCGRGQSEP